MISKSAISCLLLAFILLFSVPANAQTATGDVRNFVWGVSKADVRQFEKDAMFFEELNDEEQGEALFYLGYVSDIRTLITYAFNEGRLWRVEQQFQFKSPDPQAALDQMFAFQKEIEAINGPPAKSDFIWNNEEYKDYPNRWGLAVLRGHLTIRLTWKTPRSDITLSLKAREFEYDFRLIHAQVGMTARQPG